MEKFFFNIAPDKGKPYVTFRVEAENFGLALIKAQRDAAANFGRHHSMVWVANGGLAD